MSVALVLKQPKLAENHGDLKQKLAEIHGDLKQKLAELDRDSRRELFRDVLGLLGKLGD